MMRIIVLIMIGLIGLIKSDIKSGPPHSASGPSVRPHVVLDDKGRLKGGGVEVRIPFLNNRINIRIYL
jgi:hypothetical protein